MSDSEQAEIDGYLAAVPELRRQRIEHMLDVIERAEPHLPRRLWKYGDGIIGFGHYRYRYASGREGESFVIGVCNRKRYIAVYCNCADGERYLTESFAERLPGCKIGKSCIEVPEKTTVDDDVLTDLTRQSVAFFRMEAQKPTDYPTVPGTMQIWE